MNGTGFVFEIQDPSNLDTGPNSASQIHSCNLFGNKNKDFLKDERRDIINIRIINTIEGSRRKGEAAEMEEIISS